MKNSERDERKRASFSPLKLLVLLVTKVQKEKAKNLYAEELLYLHREKEYVFHHGTERKEHTPTLIHPTTYKKLPEMGSKTIIPVCGRI